jgi:putative acetyltransferase
MSAPLLIREESPDQPHVIRLLEARDALLSGLYPPESCHRLDLSAPLQPEVTFLVARRDGVALGCGAVVWQGECQGEIKSMFVDEAARGTGAGRALLAAVEERARGQGLTTLRLETGIHQQPALGLYRAAGYREIPPFGDYRLDPLSIFMEKRLVLEEAS